MIEIGKYIGTISGSETWGCIKRVLDSLDLHEYVVGEEVGAGGFRHYQYAVHTAGDLREYADKNSLGWHIEDVVNWEKSKLYCRKGPRVHEFADTIEFGEYCRIKSRADTDLQRDINASFSNQNDRAITVWIDHQGGNGKSTWVYLNERRGKIFSIPDAEQTPARIIDYVAMNYDNEDIILLDIPRAEKLSKSQAQALERLKDGNISSAKYQGTKRFIKGAKIGVMTNNWIPPATYKALSADRWDVHVIEKKAEIDSR